MFKNTTKELKKFINDDLREINKILDKNYEIKSLGNGKQGIKDDTHGMATLIKSANLNDLADNVNTLLHFMQLAQDNKKEGAN